MRVGGSTISQIVCCTVHQRRFAIIIIQATCIYTKFVYSIQFLFYTILYKYVHVYSIQSTCIFTEACSCILTETARSARYKHTRMLVALGIFSDQRHASFCGNAALRRRYCMM